MSRGPGRMMRAALAELERYGHTEPWSVAWRATHETRCDCGEVAECSRYQPARAELVSARRALHRLSGQGLVTLARVARQYESGWSLSAVKCCSRCQVSVETTLTSRYGSLVAYSAVRRAADLARKCCSPSETGTGTTLTAESTSGGAA